MPTGYDKKRGTKQKKKKRNVDSIALSLTNTAVKYVIVYSHASFFSKTFIELGCCYTWLFL